jgi:hypothetical protein
MLSQWAISLDGQLTKSELLPDSCMGSDTSGQQLASSYFKMTVSDLFTLPSSKDAKAMWYSVSKNLNTTAISVFLMQTQCGVL